MSLGHSVLNLDSLTYAGNPDSLRGVDCGLHRHERVDVTDLNAVRSHFAAFCPDWVIHLAAETHVDRSIDQPDTFIRTNILGTFTLLQAAREHFERLTSQGRAMFRFLHVSTDEVYGSLPGNGVFTEDSPYHPRSPYSASKAASDHLVRAWFYTYGFPVIVTNSSNNYGPYQFPEKLIPHVILKALRGDPIPVYGRGEHVRDWLHVTDHVRALLHLVEHGNCGETYNIGGDNPRRNIDLVRIICRLLDELCPSLSAISYQEQITFVSDRPGHDRRYAIDSSKLKRLGWSPAWKNDDGFAETVRWYLNRRDWWQPILDGSYRLERLGTGFSAAIRNLSQSP